MQKKKLTASLLELVKNWKLFKTSIDGKEANELKLLDLTNCKTSPLKVKFVNNYRHEKMLSYNGK